MGGKTLTQPGSTSRGHVTTVSASRPSSENSCRISRIRGRPRRWRRSLVPEASRRGPPSRSSNPAGQVYASWATRELLAGSPTGFTDRGLRELKGTVGRAPRLPGRAVRLSDRLNRGVASHRDRFVKLLAEMRPRDSSPPTGLSQTASSNPGLAHQYRTDTRAGDGQRLPDKSRAARLGSALEGVLDLLASLLEAALGFFGFAFDLEVLIVSGVADGLLGLTGELFGLVLNLVVCTHVLFLPRGCPGGLSARLVPLSMESVDSSGAGAPAAVESVGGGDADRGEDDLDDELDPVDTGSDSDPDGGSKGCANQRRHDADQQGEPDRDFLPAGSDESTEGADD